MSIFTNHDHEQELYLEDIGDESSALVSDYYNNELF